MKKLFTFQLDKKVKEKVKESSKNDKGETVTVEKEVTETKPQDIIIKKPSRSQFDDAELFYGVKLSEGIKAGLLTRALLAKRFSNDGGVLSDGEKDRYADLYLKLYETQLDTERLSATPEGKRSENDQKELDALLEQSAVLRRELTDFEMAQSSLFEQTAENRARNKTILWWVLQLSYIDDGSEKPTQVFGNGTYEERLEVYDSLEESDDEFNETLLQKLIYYVSFWYVGRVTSQEEFEKLIEDAGDEDGFVSVSDKKEVSEEPPKEEVKEEVKEVVEKDTTVEIKEESQEEPRDKAKKEEKK